MAAWLTTHYRHRSDDHPWFIYLKSRYKKKGDLVSDEDPVFFYELKGKSGMGRGCIVGLSRVTGALESNTHREGGEDEAEQLWPWCIPCGKFTKGKVEERTLDTILDRQFSRRPRIPGGVMKLTEAQALQLFGAFEAE